MPIIDADYLDDPEVTEFLYHLRNCEPTHYSDNDQMLKDSFKGSQFCYYSSEIYPEKLVIDLCMMFAKKFAAYTVGKEQTIEKVFFASMPLAIWSSAEGEPDRTLLWANGGITLSKDDGLYLFLDKDLVDRFNNDE